MFRDENSTLSRSPKAPKNLDAGCSISGFLAKLTPGCFTLNLHRRSGRAANATEMNHDSAFAPIFGWRDKMYRKHRGEGVKP